MSCDDLNLEIDAFYQGFGHGPTLMSAFRSAALWVPLAADDRVWMGVVRDIGWIPAFTSEAELARFAAARGDRTDVRFHTLYGWRIFDELAASFERPTGVLVDAVGERPMAFPPTVVE
ncbi:SseB family protein [Rhodococcus sp. HNM0569]|nr:SseB family protein [Rhodococcus sp. HNM0569]